MAKKEKMIAMTERLSTLKRGFISSKDERNLIREAIKFLSKNFNLILIKKENEKLSQSGLRLYDFFLFNGKRVKEIDNKPLYVCYGRKPISEQLIETEAIFQAERDRLGFMRITKKQLKIQELETKVNNLEKYISLLKQMNEPETLAVYQITKSLKKNMTFSENKTIVLKWSSSQTQLQEIISTMEEILQKSEEILQKSKFISNIKEQILKLGFGIFDGNKLHVNLEEGSGYFQITQHGGVYSEIYDGYGLEFCHSSQNRPLFFLDLCRYSHENKEARFFVERMREHLLKVAPEDKVVKAREKELGDYSIWVKFISTCLTDYYNLLRQETFIPRDYYNLLRLEIFEREIRLSEKKASLARTEKVYNLICLAKELGLNPAVSRKILRKFKQGQKVLSVVIEDLNNGLSLTEEAISSLIQAKEELNGYRNVSPEIIRDAMVQEKENYFLEPIVSNVFLKLSDNTFFNTASPEHIEDLHKNYGGRQVYSSNTGLTSEGYVPAEAMNELKKFKAILRHPLSEEDNLNSWGEDNYFAVFPRNESLLFVFYKDQTLYFTDSNKGSLKDFLKGETPEEGYQIWKYPYLNGCLQVRWWSDIGDSIKEMNLPYNFKVFVKLFMEDVISSLPGYSIKKSHNEICRQLNISSSGLIYGALFHLPVKRINLKDRFQEGKFFEWPFNGGVSTKDFLFRKNLGMINWFYHGNPQDMLKEFPDSIIELSGYFYEREVEMNEDILAIIKEKTFKACLEKFNVKLELPAVREEAPIEEEKNNDLKEEEVTCIEKKRTKNKWEYICSFVHRIFGSTEK